MERTFYEMCNYFEYLDYLRSSGEVNMFGAAPNLASEYGLNLKEARSVLKQWQDTFGSGELEDRVHAAQPSALPSR